MMAGMGRRATGRVDARPTKDGDTVYSFRVTDPKGGVDGRPLRPRITLGYASDGVTVAMAESRLSDTMASLRSGVDLDVLFPSTVAPDSDPGGEPTLSDLALLQLGDARSRGMAAKQIEHIEWCHGHALPVLGHLKVSELSIAIIDTLRDRLIEQRDIVRRRAKTKTPVMVERSRVDGAKWKQRARPLSDTSINRVIGGLSALIEFAMEHPNVEERFNPAAGKRRKIHVPATDTRSYLEPDQVQVYLQAARQYEKAARKQVGDRASAAECEVGILVMGALRISELCWAERARVNVGAGFMIAGRKTAAGRDRKIMLVFDALTDLLANHLANHPGSQWLVEADGGKGQRRTPGNVARMLDDIWEEAQPLAVSKGIAELERVTPHMLRRTNISLLCAAGYPPGWVARQVGHRDQKLTLRIYDQVVHAQEADVHRARANELLGARPGPEARATTSSAETTAADVVPTEWSEA
jgi:integrase